MAKGGSGFEKRLEAVMPRDAAPNGAAPAEHDLIDLASVGLRQRVSEMQANLHRWAAADPGRRFVDLFPTRGAGACDGQVALRWGERLPARPIPASLVVVVRADDLG